MISYNKVILMGHLTRDPELRRLPSGTAVANFGIAVNERYTDKQTQEQKEITTFVEVETWARQAEIVNEYLTKGRPVFIEGSLKYDSWEDEMGNKKSRVSVKAMKVQFIGTRTENNLESMNDDIPI